MSLQAKVIYLKGYSTYENVEGVLELSITGTNVKDIYKNRFQNSTSLPLELTLLLDTSGSMKPSESLLQIATSTLIKLIPCGSTSVRIITFDEVAKEIHRTQLISSKEQDELLNITSNLKVSSGCTNMNAALQMLKPNPEAMQNIVLLSDGMANAGSATESKDLVKTVQNMLEKSTLPVLCTTIGFNEPTYLQMDVLKDLASATDGSMHIVQTAEKVQESFGDVMCDVLTTVAANLKFKTVGCTICPKLSGKDKLNGIHIRMDSKRLIPFKLDSTFSWKNMEISYINILTNKVETVVVELPVPSVNGEMNFEVDEACILSAAAVAIEEMVIAKKQFLSSKTALGPQPRPPFLSPSPGIGGLFAHSPKRQALRNEDDEELEVNLQQLYEEKLKMYKEHLKKIETLTIDSAKLKLKLILDRIDANSRKELSVLQSLRKELLELYSLEIQEDFSMDERVQNLTFDLVNQRACVRDSCAPIGTLSFQSTPTQEVIRMVSRCLSQQPEVDVETATLVFEDSLEKKE
jgi:von Willebrand factor type A domain